MASLVNAEQTEFFRTGREGESRRQCGNIKVINNTVLGDKTGSVQGNETGIVLSSYSSNNIRGAEFSTLISALVEGTGLHSIPSYYTSIPLVTDDVAVSCTWSDALSSGSGAI